MSDDEDDTLKEIKDYHGLLEILEQNFPTSLTAYGWLKSRLCWMKKSATKNKFHVYSPEGNVHNGIVLTGNVGEKTYLVTIYTFKNDFSKLAATLLKTRKIKWSEANTIGINMENVDEMRCIIDKLGFAVHNDIGSKVWELRMEDALGFHIECADDIYLSPLKSDDIPKVNENWALKFDGSEDYLRRLIDLNDSMGIYTKDNDVLISWAIECEYSEIGVLYTVPEHRRKGLAQLVVKKLAQRIAEDKNFAIGFTLMENKTSEIFFDNLGFKYVCDYGFLEYGEVRQ